MLEQAAPEAVAVAGGVGERLIRGG